VDKKIISSLIGRFLNEGPLTQKPFAPVLGGKDDSPDPSKTPEPASKENPMTSRLRPRLGTRGTEGGVCACRSMKCKEQGRHVPNGCENTAHDQVDEETKLFVCPECARVDPERVTPKRGPTEWHGTKEEEKKGIIPPKEPAQPGTFKSDEELQDERHNASIEEQERAFKALSSTCPASFKAAHGDRDFQTYMYGGERTDQSNDRERTAALTPGEISFLMNDRGYTTTALEDYIDPSTGMIRTPMSVGKARGGGRRWSANYVRASQNFLFHPDHWEGANEGSHSHIANQSNMVPQGKATLTAKTPEAKEYERNKYVNASPPSTVTKSAAKVGDVVTAKVGEETLFYYIDGVKQDGSVSVKPAKMGLGLAATEMDIGEEPTGTIVVVTSDKAQPSLLDLGLKQGELVFSRMNAIQLAPDAKVQTIEDETATLTDMTCQTCGGKNKGCKTCSGSGKIKPLNLAGLHGSRANVFAATNPDEVVRISDLKGETPATPAQQALRADKKGGGRPGRVTAIDALTGDEVPIEREEEEKRPARERDVVRIMIGGKPQSFVILEPPKETEWRGANLRGPEQRGPERPASTTMQFKIADAKTGKQHNVNATRFELQHERDLKDGRAVYVAVDTRLEGSFVHDVDGAEGKVIAVDKGAKGSGIAIVAWTRGGKSRVPVDRLWKTDGIIDMKRVYDLKRSEPGEHEMSTKLERSSFEVAQDALLELSRPICDLSLWERMEHLAETVTISEWIGEDEVPCKKCGGTFDVVSGLCRECGEEEDLAVDRAQQRDIDRWNSEPAEEGEHDAQERAAWAGRRQAIANAVSQAAALRKRDEEDRATTSKRVMSRLGALYGLKEAKEEDGKGGAAGAWEEIEAGLDEVGV
jgi:hypothetical protein